MSWLTAEQALAALGVRPQTLYANVSRKKIRTRSNPRDTRRSLYHEGDVRALVRNRKGRRKAAVVAEGTMEWGDSILPSAVSTVMEGRLWYRGQDAVVLSASFSLEDVACLLWNAPRADFTAVDRRFRSRGSTALGRAFAALADRAATDLPSMGRALNVLQEEAASVVTTLVNAMLGDAGQALPVHERCAAIWKCRKARDALRRVLVLLADHELNASTFAARVTVSTGASLSAGLLAGLATLTGPLHGQASIGVAQLLESARRRGAEAAVRDHLAQGRPLVGFGHPLYPAGDVRAACLLQDLAMPADMAELIRVTEDLTGERPNIDFALAVLTRLHALPSDAPLILFALARCVGWSAHALEQATSGHLIRPRARYVGVLPPGRKATS